MTAPNSTSAANPDDIPSFQNVSDRRGDAAETEPPLDRATLVVQGYSAKRVNQLCKWVHTARSWSDLIEAVLVVWNGARSNFRCDGVAEADRWSKTGDIFASRVHFAAHDLLDNHYVVPATLDIPSAVALVMDDDVTTDRASVACMIEIWRADTRLLVPPAHSARGFSRTQMAMSGHQAAFCAFLPQMLLVHKKYLVEYARHAALRALVNATPVCEDYAFGAAVGVAARRLAGPLDDPLMVHAVAIGLNKHGGDGHGIDDLSGARGFRSTRSSCPTRVADVIRSNRDGLFTGQPFVPSTLTLQCGASNISAAREQASIALKGRQHAGQCRI